MNINVGMKGTMEYRVTKNVNRWIEARFFDGKEKEAARETVEYLKACFPDKAEEMDRDIILEGKCEDKGELKLA